MDVSVYLHAFSWSNILIAVAGTAAGIFLGALPGVGTLLSITLALPFTFGMSASSALILLGGIFSGAVYGGSISAILLNVPGTAASAVTCLDGYAFTRKGKPSTALTLATVSSAVGGLAGTTALIFASPLLSEFSLQFGPREFFMLSLMGIVMIARASPENTIKGIISGLIGLALAMVGLGSLTAFPRFTFGIPYFYDGFQLVPTVIGMFGLSEVLVLLGQKQEAKGQARPKVGGCSLADVLLPFKMPFTLIKSSIIGVIIGVIPGVGGEVSNTVAYMEAKRSSPRGKYFGQGEPEGIVAAESANNGSVSSSLIPFLTLGVPGSAVAALFSAPLLMHGLCPGRDLFTVNADITGSFFVGLVLANLAMLALGLAGVRLWSRLVTVPRTYLLGTITLLCLSGAFAARNSFYDMIYAVVIGCIGYAFRRGGFSLPALLIGFVLGGLAEESFGQGILMGGGKLSYFLGSTWALVFFAFAVFILLEPFIRQILKPIISGRRG